MDQDDGASWPDPVNTPPESGWAMMPKSVLCSGLDDHCKLLYALVDLAEGPKGSWTVPGFAAIGELLGWQARTVATHAGHLTDLGLVRIEHGKGEATVAARLRITHQPARGRRVEGVELPKPQGRHKKLSKYADVPRPAQGSPDDGDGADPVRPFTDEPGPVARQTRFVDAPDAGRSLERRPAPDAGRPKSAGNEGKVSADVGARDCRTATEKDSAQAKLLSTSCADCGRLRPTNTAGRCADCATPEAAEARRMGSSW